jgi:hypothetical protein
MTCTTTREVRVADQRNGIRESRNRQQCEQAEFTKGISEDIHESRSPETYSGEMKI